MKNLFSVIFFALALSFSFTLNAQIKTPQPSPSAKLTQAVGLSDITIEYSRPGVKGRTVFGDLVPYGKVWRTGANASTKVTFGEDVMIGGKELKAGKYALYTIPGMDKWTVIFHKKTAYWGVGDYNEADDALRVDVKAMKLPMSVETMTFDINNIKDDGADILFMWANTMLAIPVKLNTHEVVSASINKVMAGPSANDYAAAASYYLSTNTNMPQALKWMNKALEIGGDKFWLLRRKALIQSKMNDFRGAIETAKLSKELAMKAGNADYVKMNEKSIKEWMKK